MFKLLMARYYQKTYRQLATKLFSGHVLHADETEVQFPRIIVEVLSDSTEAYDRGKKFGYYRACPTIDEYVLVASKYQSVEVYRRTAQGWTAYHAYGPGDEIELTSIDVRFPLAALYRSAVVPETTDATAGEV